MRRLRMILLAAGAACAMTAGALAAETGTISGDVVNVREGPGTDYGKVEMLSQGRQVTVLGEESGWYHVQWNDSTGYILKDYVSVASGDGCNASVTGGSTVNVRSGPGTEYDRVTRVSEGKRITLLESCGEWYHVSVDGTSGYIMSGLVSPDGGVSLPSAPAPAPARSVEPAAAPEPEPASEYPTPGEPGQQPGNAVVYGGSVINVRSGPGTNYSRVTKVGAGKRLTMVSRVGDWFEVSFDGVTGYMLGDYLVPDYGVLDTLPEQETAVEEPVVMTAQVEESAVSGDARGGLITGGTINVRSGPGTEYDRVGHVYSGMRVSILGEENGWYLVQWNDSTGYVMCDFVLEGVTLVGSPVGQQVASMAMNFLGTRYVYGGSAPGGFDCSGFSSYLYRQFGYSLPHSASAQYASCGYKVSKGDLMPGDLVFFSSNGGSSITHVGVYLGGGDVIHARYSIGRVHINNLSESYYTNNYVGAVRIA